MEKPKSPKGGEVPVPVALTAEDVRKTREVAERMHQDLANVRQRLDEVAGLPILDTIAQIIWEILKEWENSLTIQIQNLLNELHTIDWPAFHGTVQRLQQELQTYHEFLVKLETAIQRHTDSLPPNSVEKRQYQNTLKRVQETRQNLEQDLATLGNLYAEIQNTVFRPIIPPSSDNGPDNNESE